VKLSFKRAPMATKGLFGTVAAVGPTSSAAVTTMPSFNFGVKQAGAAPSTGGGAFTFGLTGTTSANSTGSTGSTAAGGFSFGVTKTQSAEATDTDTATEGEGAAAAAAEEAEAVDDAKE